MKYVFYKIIFQIELKLFIIPYRIATAFNFSRYFFKLGFISYKAEQPQQGIELQEKEPQKD